MENVVSCSSDAECDGKGSAMLRSGSHRSGERPAAEKTRKTKTTSRYSSVSHKHKGIRGHKKGKKKKYSSSSSTSSTSCTSYDSDSDSVTSKKQSSRRKKKLFDVFRKNYMVLSSLFRLCPDELANKLFSKGIIPAGALQDVISQDVLSKKVNNLLALLSHVFELKPEKLFVLIDILKEDKALEDVAQQISGEIKLLKVESSQESACSSGAIVQFGEYLKSYYSAATMCDDKRSIFPSRLFLDLHLAETKQSLTEESSTCTKVTNCLQLDDLLLSDSRVVLVEGAPGIGKSTLCLELCKKWDALKSLQRYKIVLLLKLRERRVQSATKLDELFYHDDRSLSLSVESEVLKCNGDGVLFILDGFDELPREITSDAGSLLMRLMYGKCLPKGHILLTSRPSAKHLTEIYSKKVKVIGFDKGSIDLYLKSTLEPKFCELVMSNHVFMSLMYSPINCAIIALVYKEMEGSKNPIPKTMTQLYTTLVLVLIRRHMIEKGEWDEDRKVPESLISLPEELCAKLKRVAKLAYDIGILREILSEKLVFTDEEVGENFQHLGLLCETKEMYVLGAKTFYSFLHVTIQEFLAAWHLSRNPDLASDDLLSAIPLFGLSAFGHFVSGFLGCDRLFLRYAISTRLFVQYLYEEQDHCRSAHKGHILSSKYLCTNPWDLHTFGYVLAHASLQWELYLKDYSDMSQLVYSVMNCKKILGSISKLAVGRFWTLNKIEELPSYLLQRISELEINFPSAAAARITWMTSLCNLQTLSLDDTCSPEEAPLLYQAIKSYSKLKKFCFSFTDNLAIKDLGALSECIASSRSLEYVKVLKMNRYSPDGNKDFTNEIRELRRLVEAAFSCSTLKTLCTCIPFTCTSLSCCLESIIFIFPGLNSTAWSSEIVVKCLLSIIAICKMPSMRSLELILCGNNYTGSDEIFAALNYSLNCNPYLTSLKFDLQLPSDYCVGAHNIRPNLLSWNRSKSLNDLVTPVYVNPMYNAGICPGDHVCLDHDGNIVKYLRVRSRSCPDLSQEQSSLTMHPCLCKALHCDKLNYPMKRWDVYRIANSASATIPPGS